MAFETSEPRTPQRNSNLVSAWSRNQRIVSSPNGPAPRRVVLPASAPPDTPKTTDRIRRLTFDPTIPSSQRPPVYPSLPPNVPTEPAAMRKASQPQQAVPHPSTPRRRIVPNVHHDDETEVQPHSHTRHNSAKYIPPFQPCLPFTPRLNKISEKRIKEECCSHSYYDGTMSYGYSPQNVPRPNPTGFYNSPDVLTGTRNGLVTSTDIRTNTQFGFVTTEETFSAIVSDPFNSQDARKPAGPSIGLIKDNVERPHDSSFDGQRGRTITGTEFVNYTPDQQAVDYKDLMADSEPEETWESRRGAPMVPEAHSWIESDLFAQQWYNAIILSYRQDSQNGERLGGTEEEREIEMQAKKAGHLTGVSVELEVARHNFEADLLRRARDMILRDNGIMPRGGIGKPAIDEEPQPWSDGIGGTRQ